MDALRTLVVSSVVCWKVCRYILTFRIVHLLPLEYRRETLSPDLNLNFELNARDDELTPNGFLHKNLLKLLIVFFPCTSPWTACWYLSYSANVWGVASDLTSRIWSRTETRL
jgi:hypothetical protein